MPDWAIISTERCKALKVDIPDGFVIKSKGQVNVGDMLYNPQTSKFVECQRDDKNHGLYVFTCYLVVERKKQS